MNNWKQSYFPQSTSRRYRQNSHKQVAHSVAGVELLEDRVMLTGFDFFEHHDYEEILNKWTTHIKSVLPQSKLEHISEKISDFISEHEDKIEKLPDPIPKIVDHIQEYVLPALTSNHDEDDCELEEHNHEYQEMNYSQPFQHLKEIKQDIKDKIHDVIEEIPEKVEKIIHKFKDHLHDNEWEQDEWMETYTMENYQSVVEETNGNHHGNLKEKIVEKIHSALSEFKESFHESLYDLKETKHDYLDEIKEKISSHHDELDDLFQHSSLSQLKYSFFDHLSFLNGHHSQPA